MWFKRIRDRFIDRLLEEIIARLEKQPNPLSVNINDVRWADDSIKLYKCCDHCSDDTIHDVERDGHTVPCDEINCGQGKQLTPPKGMPF